MVITEVIQSLGFGEQVTLAAVMGLILLYLFRARSFTKTIVGAIGTVWLGAVSITLAAAVAIYMGWVDPSPAAFISDVLAGVKAAIDVVFDLIGDRLP